MEQKKHEKHRLGVFGRVILAHFGVSIIHILLFDMGHPLFEIANEYPVALQIVLVSVYAFVVYLATGFLASYTNKHHKGQFYLDFDWSILYFAGVLLIVYGVLLLISLWRNIRNLWLVYSLVNAYFGTYMYRLPDGLFYQLWWAISVFIPPLAMYIGSLIRMKFEEMRK